MIGEPESLRADWSALCADPELDPLGFVERASTLVDRHVAATFRSAFESTEVAGAALVALGSYGRRELCPKSDLDLVLVYDRVRDLGRVADGLWYPLWDAGFVLGHGVRTIREAMALGDDDTDALFAMLDARHVVGDLSLTRALVDGARDLAQRRRGRLVEVIARGVEERAASSVAELLEPDLKRGGGGLRDAQVIAYAGDAVGSPGGVASLVARGYLGEGDALKVSAANRLLLATRVALHLATGSRNDALRLQEQDGVAVRLGIGDADELARCIAGAGRDLSWIAADTCARLRSREAGPIGRVVRRDRLLAPGVVARDGRATLLADVPADGDAALRLAASAARHDLPLEPRSLARLADCTEPTWADPAARTWFFELLLQGRPALRAIEALDHVGAFAVILPEWDRLRALPQRNPYHRYNVDRHLLATVSECVDLLSDTGFDGQVAAGVERAELLVLSALLHDAAKGLPGDHSVVGADLAVRVCRRIGLDSAGTSLVETVVRHHLLMADVATRRDLSEESTVARVARALGDIQTARTAYLLTVADSRATGPAAWGHSKAELVRELYAKVLGLLERDQLAPGPSGCRRGLRERIGARADVYLDAMPPTYERVFDAATAERHLALFSSAAPAVGWSDEPGSMLGCAVVCPDRTGLLSTVTGVLSLFGYDVRSAWVFTREDGVALEVFSGLDRFHRLSDPRGRGEVLVLLRDVVAGTVDVAQLVEERSLRYPGQSSHDVAVVVDQAASDFATVLEVHAGDEPGLLHRVTAVLAAAGLDVHLAKVATLGDRVVDTFYLRDAAGGKVTDDGMLQTLRASLELALRATTADGSA